MPQFSSMKTPIKKEETAFFDYANCKGQPLSLFFENDSDVRTAKLKEALSFCRACDVQEECLKYAIDHSQNFGIFGGMTSNQRARYRVAYNKKKRTSRAAA